MRTYGEIAGVSFNRIGWNIYNLATEYRLYDGENTKLVYVNTMLELKKEIREFAGVSNEEVREEHSYQNRTAL